MFKVGKGIPIPLCQIPKYFHNAFCGIHTWLLLHFNLFHLIGFYVFLQCVVMAQSFPDPWVIFIVVTFSFYLGCHAIQLSLLDT